MSSATTETGSVILRGPSAGGRPGGDAPREPFSPTPTLLSRVTTLRRVPTRPPEARQPGFEAAFDDDTLWFDAFRSPDGRHAVLLGPPHLNLAGTLAGAVVRDRQGGPALPVRARTLDRHSQLWVAVAPACSALEVDAGFGRIAVPVGPNLSDLFAGRRVLLTKSRDNPLPWILDWVRYNRDVNGADAVLLYDNGSTAYRPADVRAALDGVGGIDAVAVVDWPFRFGPQGLDAWRHWDSDFCELGILEHARWRFLARARSVLNADVDEFPLGSVSPFVAAERSLVGMVRYGGRLVIETGEGPSAAVADRRHRHYGAVLRRQPGRGRFGLPVDRVAERPKWTVVPARCPARAQWHVHSVKGWPLGLPLRRALGHRHFRPITTSWKYDREGAVPFDPALHERDGALAAAMARVDWER